MARLTDERHCSRCGYNVAVHLWTQHQDTHDYLEAMEVKPALLLQCPDCGTVFHGREHVCLPTPAEAVRIAEAWLLTRRTV